MSWFIRVGVVEVSVQIDERGTPNFEQSANTKRDEVYSSWYDDELGRWHRWVVNVPHHILAIELSAFQYIQRAPHDT